MITFIFDTCNIANLTSENGVHSEEALAISVSLLGAKPSGKAMENSLSAFASLSSTAESKDLSDEEMNSSLSQEDSEDGGNLTGDCEEVTLIPRPLSPSQYVGSLMKPSGSREKLFALAATASPANLSSTSLPLSHYQPCPKHKDTTDSDIEQWMKGQEEWGRQRKRRTTAVEAGKSAGSPKPPAGSSSSSSVSKQATARQVAAELIRLGDTSLSAPLLNTSGTVDNLLSSQVDHELTDRELGLELEHNGVHITDFIANSRARHQKDRDAKAEALKIMGSSSSLVHASFG